MSFAVAAIGALGGMLIAGMQKTPSIQAPAAPEAPPASQAAQMPDANKFLQANMGAGQAGGAPGIAQTFLTGSSGVDPFGLLLGKTTLLGGGGGMSGMGTPPGKG